MITDYLLTFSNGQTVSAAADSTDILDMGPLYSGNTTRDIGAGENLYLVVVAESGFASGTLAVSLKTGLTDSAITKVLATSGAVDCATAPKGQPVIVLPIPRGVQRYLRVSYTPTTATGTLWAGIVKDVQDVKYYTSASEVL